MPPPWRPTIVAALLAALLVPAASEGFCHEEDCAPAEACAAEPSLAAGPRRVQLLQTSATRGNVGLARFPSELAATSAPLLAEVRHRGGVAARDEPWLGTYISRMLGSDILGDALEPTNHGGTVPAAEAHAALPHEKTVDHGSHHVLFFFFGILVTGSAILIVVERHAPLVQSTCALFAGGVFISFMHYSTSEDSPCFWNSWNDSVERWQAINPHLLFYTFLPALIFGEAMKMNVRLFKASFWQVFLLSCPGVLMGTVLVASVVKYMLPYGWDWPICLVLGAMLSATDPVAVVALFNTLGVSPKLTMLISGESLLNDGSAICAFVLTLKVALGAHVSPYDVMTFFAHMMITSVAVGFFLGIAAVTIISICAEEHYRSDAMIQFVVTVCCGYLAFFLAESELSTSGVLTTVTAGLVTAYFAWPRFVSRETMRIVWEAIDFIANTVIFFLAGVLFGDVCLSRLHLISFLDVLWLLVLYVSLHVIRALIVLIFWLPMNRVGKPLHWKEGVVMIWSGLRGAIGLALAIIVDMEPEINQLMGARIMFHMGGIATLTMLVNATTTPQLLQWLGITKMSQVKQRLMLRLDTLMVEEAVSAFEEEMGRKDDVRFTDINTEIVRAMVPALRRVSMAEAASSAEAEEEAPGGEDALAQLYREAFLKVVQGQYWEAIEQGVLPRCMSITRVLLHSTDAALDDTRTGLYDWNAIAVHTEQVLHPSGIWSFLDRLSELPGLALVPVLRRALSNQVHIRRLVYIALCFQDAHARAREEVPHYFGVPAKDDNGRFSRVRQQVDRESLQACEKAAQLLLHVPPDAIELGKCKMLARKLLQRQMNSVAQLQEKGLLNESEVTSLRRQMVDASREILHKPRDTWFQASASLAPTG